MAGRRDEADARATGQHVQPHAAEMHLSIVIAGSELANSFIFSQSVHLLFTGRNKTFDIMISINSERGEPILKKPIDHVGHGICVCSSDTKDNNGRDGWREQDVRVASRPKVTYCG